MDITDNLRDAAYIVIGMGVIGAQRAQVRREELRKSLATQREVFEARAADARARFETRGAEAVKLVGDLVKQADARVEPIIGAVEAQIDAVADRLPPQAKTLVTQANQTRRDVRAQVRTRINN
jgi:type II secretory pathway pseudopilin PulG